MSFIAIILNFFIEHHNIFKSGKKWFSRLIYSYAQLFMQKEFTTVRQIRVSFILAMIPFAIVIGLMQFLHLINHLSWIYMIINGILFIFVVDMLGWKEEAKETNRNKDYQNFVQSYATNFFATTLWFILLPSILGSICYLALTAMANILRRKSINSMIYADVIDKMLFWINVLPYTILFIFIAIAGDFEAVMHQILAQKSKVKVSYFYLENLLNEIVYVAIGKDKFQMRKPKFNDDGFEAIERHSSYDPQVIDYIVALLYRTGVFFIASIICISIADLL